MQKAKHSKFKNTGILFELLTRQVTADILSNKKESVAKDLLFKYFKESKELGKELQLYNFLINEQFLDDKKASRALEVVLRARNKLNNKQLNAEKYELIKEIKTHYPIDAFLKSSIKNYKSYASIYKLFSDSSEGANFELNEIIQSKDYIIENLVKAKAGEEKKKTDSLTEVYLAQEEGVRLLAYKFLIENLNKKYDCFSSEQKKLLREYINSISNTNNLPMLIIEESKRISEELRGILEKIDSKVTKIKVTEVVNQLSSLNLSRGVKDNHILMMLMSYELLSEIKKVLNSWTKKFKS